VALYILDTNVWIHIGRHHPPDPFVNFWRQLDDSIASGEIRSPEDVLHEVEAGSDDLASVLKRHSGLFVPLDEATMAAAGEIIDGCEGLVDPEGERNRADPFVVALARSRGGTVVTRERGRRGPTGRPRIPDACRQFGVPWLDWFSFLKAIAWAL